MNGIRLLCPFFLSLCLHYCTIPAVDLITCMAIISEWAKGRSTVYLRNGSGSAARRDLLIYSNLAAYIFTRYVS